MEQPSTQANLEPQPVMASLSTTAIATLLLPFLPEPAQTLLDQLQTSLDLLLKWNARTNLTAIRDPEDIVRRHFGESIFAAQQLGNTQTLLDYGTGAGFPGIPIALLHPGIAVTLAESQNKKVAFLREAVRTLGLKTEIWPRRVEEMPAGMTFETVTLRAVDAMTPAIEGAAPRAAEQLLLLTTTQASRDIHLPAGFEPDNPIPMPASTDRIVLRLTRKI